MLVPFLGMYQPFAAISHLSAAVMCLMFCRNLFSGRVKERAVFYSLCLFVTMFLFLFLMSGTYHAMPPGGYRALFRQLDHAAIWLVIAASFTPPHVILLKKFWRFPFLAVVWGCGLTGLVLKSIFLNSIPGWVGIILYCSFGCLGMVSGGVMVRDHGWHKVRFCFYGSGIYLIGGVFEIWGKSVDYVLIPGVIRHHEIFHIFVIAGALCHWYWVWNLSRDSLATRS